MIGRPRRARDQQRTRRILVEAVDQLGPSAVIGQPVEQAIEMLRSLGAALRREARRLVEHEGARISIDHHVAHQLLFLWRQLLALTLRTRRPRRHGLERGNTDLLPRFDPVARHRALAGQPQLPGPRPARNQVEADIRHVPLEPAVEANAVVVVADGKDARVGHAGAALAMLRATPRSAQNSNACR